MIQAITKPVNRPRLTPVRAIREYCKTVCAGSPKETRLCTVSACPLYGFRQGKHSARAGIGVGPRSRRGRFLPKSDRSTGGSLPGKGPGSVDWGSATSGSNCGKNKTSDIEWPSGAVRIKQTSSGMLITLTKARWKK
jgi:hypothetical protein